MYRFITRIISQIDKWQINEPILMKGFIYIIRVKYTGVQTVQDVLSC